MSDKESKINMVQFPDRNLWIILKIYPEVNPQNPFEFYSKVIEVKNLVFSELLRISNNNRYYFIHYSDAPEGPHFKFAIRCLKNMKEILDWRLTKINLDSIKHIEILIEENDKSKEQANSAREVFNTIDKDKIKFLDSLRGFLENNDKYNSLENEGKHFTKNMLGLTYQEEIYLGL